MKGINRLNQKHAIYIERLTKSFQEEARNNLFTYYPEEPVVCSRFGCPAILSPQERVFGDRCVAHQKATPFPSLIEPYIFQ